jgi:hypothetical protein
MHHPATDEGNEEAKEDVLLYVPMKGLGTGIEANRVAYL